MCGIATISIGRRARGRIPYEKLRRLTGELMLELQPRGLDASGIAVINEPGTEQSVVFKKPLRPARFTARPMFGEMLQRIGPHTNFVMLHARATTVGDTSDNFNNHPIIVPGAIGIHNGTLYNHERLFRQFSNHFPQGGDVDSEVIFRLFRHYTDRGLSPQRAIQETSRRLWGAFTGAVIDWDHPHRMVMFKNERSLCVVRIPHYDMVITVSESKFYARAMKRLRIKPKEKVEYVYDGVGFVIDLNAGGRIVDNLQDFDLPVDTKSWKQQVRPWLRYGADAVTGL